MKNDQVGLFTQNPGFKVDVAGDLFVRTNAGSLHLGLPDGGNYWSMYTILEGKNMILRHRPRGAPYSADNWITFFGSSGDMRIGGNSVPSLARLELVDNSGISRPHLLLTEEGGDYSRISFENTVYPDKRWTVAGYPGSSPATSKLNFWFQDAEGGTDIMTVEGDGNVSIMGSSPSARLHIHQRGQVVGYGLRFDDGINQDWDITHGFGLRLHYGGNLRGIFSATTGEYIQSSDKRLKEKIRKMPDILPSVLELQPLNYQYKNTKSNQSTLGFIAQDVEPLFPELVHYSTVDQVYGINYAGFSVVAIKAIQELKAEIDSRDDHIRELENRLARIEKLLTEGQSAQNHLILEGNGSVDRSEIKQNIPNPFSSHTTISYVVPESAKQVHLQFADSSGKVLRRFEITQRGQVQTTLDAAALPTGTYYYSLWVDGTLVGSKKMVLMK